jgi:O-antigen/teichoic acid export membrane protein
MHAPTMNTPLFQAAAWSAGGKLVAVVTSLAAVVLIARWIGPQAYGAYALAWIAIALAEIVVGGTLAECLVQSKDVDDGHADATFWASCALAVAAAALIAAAAVPIAALLGGDALLAEILPWRAASLPLTAAAAIPIHLMVRATRFRALAGCETGAAVAGNLAGIAMALAGLGVWSLVWMEFVRLGVLLVALFALNAWRPGRRGTWRHLHTLMHFNASTIATRALAYAERTVPRLVIGRVLGTEALGYYALAQRLVDQLHSVLVGPAYNVALGAAGAARSDPARVRALLRSAVHASSVAAFPMYFGLIATAPLLVPFVFGAQWTGATLAVQLFLLIGVRAPVAAFNAAVLRGIGRPMLQLAIPVTTTVLTVALVPWAAGWGLAAVVAAVVASRFAGWPLSMLMVRRATGMPIREQASLGAAPLAAAVTMGVAVMALSAVLPDSLSAAASIAAGAAAGAAVYAIVLALLSRPAARAMGRFLNAARRGDASGMRQAIRQGLRASDV